MNGPPLFVVAAIVIPDARQCLVFAAPFLAIFALRWVLQHIDHTVDRLFPHWEWERRLGWLNLRLQRRTEAVLRWIGYFLYALLAAALYGIVWAASTLGRLDNWNDPAEQGDLALQLSVILICLGVWLVYLGLELLPKLRRQYEADELEKFRAELAARESERDEPSDSRLSSKLEKPRSNLTARPGRYSPGN